MKEEIGVSGPSKRECLSIKYEDVFNLKELYKAIRDWLITNNYVTAKESEKMEKFYLEKIHPNGAKEMWIWWRTDRAPHDSKYFKYHLNVDFHVLGMKDVEIMHQGQKLKANKGEIEVLLNAWLETEAEVEIEKTFLYSILGGFISRFFRRKVYKKQIDQHKDDLKEDLDKLQNFIKQFLELKSFLPRTEMFYPARGLG